MEKYDKVISRIIYICMVVLLIGSSIVMAAEALQADRLEATMDQYFELGASEIKTVEGQNKQVIMELWGYNIEFKRI